MLRKNELRSEVLDCFHHYTEVNSYQGQHMSHLELASLIVDRVLALIQKEPDVNKR